MDVKTKKLADRGIFRMETGGEIKEIVIDEKLEEPRASKVNICFRGNRSSGIVGLSLEEAEKLQKTLSSKLKIVKDIKSVRQKV